jgi:hypothetical protein
MFEIFCASDILHYTTTGILEEQKVFSVRTVAGDR